MTEPEGEKTKKHLQDLVQKAQETKIYGQVVEYFDLLQEIIDTAEQLSNESKLHKIDDPTTERNMLCAVCQIPLGKLTTYKGQAKIGLMSCYDCTNNR